MKIVVIAGNHDSASRLESDRRLWELADVTVLGGIARDVDGKADLDRHVIEVGGKGIVAAVPFAYPASFPQVKDEVNDREHRQAAYFHALLDHANARNHDGVPVVLMAHLAVNNSDFTGHDRNMMMECVELHTLGTGYDYLALGHIHRPQQVSERSRYCGTPVPVSFDEQCEHSVSIVTIESHGAQPVIETKRINNIKPLHTLPSSEPIDFEDAMALLQSYDPTQPAYIRLNVKVDRFLPHGAMEAAALAVEGKECRFCAFKKTATVVEQRSAVKMTVDELNKLQPIDVANQYYSDKTGKPMNEEEQEMFNYIYRLVQEENRQ